LKEGTEKERVLSPFALAITPTKPHFKNPISAPLSFYPPRHHPLQAPPKAGTNANHFSLH